MTIRECSSCNKIKNLSEFYNGNQYHCKECQKERARASRINNPEYHKEYQRKRNLKRYFNITINDYDDLLKQQNGVCTICKEVCKTGNRLSVDHCHKTNKIRGLLCVRCNNGLGNFKDNCAILYNAIKYLEVSRVDG